MRKHVTKKKAAARGASDEGVRRDPLIVQAALAVLPVLLTRLPEGVPVDYPALAQETWRIAEAVVTEGVASLAATT